MDVKWFFRDDPQPFFQWLPGRPPQTIGDLFRHRLDLKVSILHISQTVLLKKNCFSQEGMHQLIEKHRKSLNMSPILTGDSLIDVENISKRNMKDRTLNNLQIKKCSSSYSRVTMCILIWKQACDKCLNYLQKNIIFK